MVLDGVGFSFERHEYLRALYDETSPYVVVMKAAQVGGTTWAVLKALHAALTGYDVIYYSPTRTGGLEFSKARVDPLIEENTLLADQVTTDTAGFKRIGGARVYFRGTRSSVDLKSVPADLVVLDELDEVAPKARLQAKARLHHSAYRFILELSNPSVPDFGIHEAYQLSDQRHWMIKCPSNHWTCLEMEFPVRLGQEVKILKRRADGSCFAACVTCGAELDVSCGQWVASWPDRDIRGYQISQLICPTVDPADILNEYENTRFPDVFYNLRLGGPYTDLERRLEASFLLTLCGSEPMLESSDERCFMGVDTGTQLHAVILQRDPDQPPKHRLVRLEVCNDFARIDDLMRRFRVRTCVIDGLPEQHASRAFAARHPNKVFLHFFNEHQRGEFAFNRDAHKVESNRTEALDASRAALRERLIVLPRQEPVVEMFARHNSADAKKLEEDPETGLRNYRYFKTGENHFSSAVTYAWIATQHRLPGQGVFDYYRNEARRLKRR